MSEESMLTMKKKQKKKKQSKLNLIQKAHLTMQKKVSKMLISSKMQR